MKEVVTAPVSFWLDADVAPPPSGSKLLLLTNGGIAVIGNWGPGFVAWAPLPKVPPSIKEKLLWSIKGSAPSA